LPYDYHVQAPNIYVSWSRIHLYLVKKCHCSSCSILNQFFTHLIDSSKSLTTDESIHNSLNRITFESILFSLNRFTKIYDLHWINSSEGWTVSFFIMGSLESIHSCTESFHPSCILGLSFAVWIDSLIQWIDSPSCFCAIFCSYHPSLYIVSSTQLTDSLNHLQLFTLGLKNSLHINSSRLNTFS